MATDGDDKILSSCLNSCINDCKSPSFAVLTDLICNIDFIFKQEKYFILSLLKFVISLPNSVSISTMIVLSF